MIGLLNDACTWAMPSVTTRLIFFLVLPAAGLLMVYPLLFDRTARTLAGPGIGTRALTTQWQAAAMAQAEVTAQIHQPLDRHSHLATTGCRSEKERFGKVGAQNCRH